MAEPENPADLALKARKIRDTAMIMPLFGLMVLTPPIANLFAVSGRILGVPVIVAYIFAVWALLILGAALLARRLWRSGDLTERLQGREQPKYPDGSVP
ncbi:MAG: hypothetical protein AAGD47_10385 [Pseudomonadota bacterium]